MSEAQDTFQRIAGELILAIDPLREAFGDVDKFRALMLKLGWEAEAIPESYVALGSAIAEAAALVEDLAEGICHESMVSRSAARVYCVRTHGKERRLLGHCSSGART